KEDEATFGVDQQCGGTCGGAPGASAKACWRASPFWAARRSAVWGQGSTRAKAFRRSRHHRRSSRPSPTWHHPTAGICASRRVGRAAAVEPVSRMLALASADSGDISLFSPRPTYAATNADATVMVEATPKPAPPAAPAAKVALASATAKPAKPRSNHVLNESQIASIKKRLALTPEQERYWPAGEAELRKMGYSKKSAQGGSRRASVDNSK